MPTLVLRRDPCSGQSHEDRAGRPALLSLFAAFAVLPSCITRDLWRHDPDDAPIESCGMSMAMVRSADGQVLRFRESEEDEAFRQRCQPHGANDALLLDPFERRSTTAELLQRFADASVRPRLEVTVVDGTKDASLSFVVPRNVAGAEAEAWHRPGVTKRTWCFTCRAEVHVFHTACRVVAAPAGDSEPPPTMIAQVARVPREPVPVGRQVVLTPFAVRCDAMLPPFELPAIRAWR